MTGRFFVAPMTIEHYRIHSLTNEVAGTIPEEIIELHNLIPFQHWTIGELFASGDKSRNYYLKWQLSHFATLGKRVVGVCIGFFDRDSKPADPFFYIHRIVVAKKHRRQKIGSSLVKAFCHTALEASQTSYTVVVQTPMPGPESDAISAFKFYKTIGFVPVGVKSYPNRLDIIFQQRIEALLSSNHLPDVGPADAMPGRQ
jgi:GNAT superfamily N-acetyltransferase